MDRSSLEDTLRKAGGQRKPSTELKE